MFEGMFGGGFNAAKLKPQLKMACGRIQIASNKKAALLKQSMREVACLLAEDPPKDEKARIRAEALIRDDNLIEAYEILQLECELLHERIKLIQYSKTCPHDLISVVSTLIWASHRVDIPELLLIRKQFVAKYGKVFEENAMRNYDGCLNERVVAKLSVEPPAAYLVQTYLERICEQFEVQWTPSMKLSSDQMIQPMAPPVGFSVGYGQGTGLGGQPPPMSSASTTITTDSADPSAMPSAPSFKASTGTSFRNTNNSNNQTPQQPPSNNANDNNNMFDEPDIFVPGGAPSSNKKNDDETIKTSTSKDDDDDNNTNDNNDASDSYADLAARFNSLKK